jgi:hypothetical protein
LNGETRNFEIPDAQLRIRGLVLEPPSGRVSREPVGTIPECVASV